MNNSSNNKRTASERDWHLSRKQFVKTMLLSGVALQLPFLSSCSDDNEIVGDISPFNREQFLTIRAVQNVLFPDDGNGPGAKQINADTYLVWALNDDYYRDDSLPYFVEQIDEFIKASAAVHAHPFYELDFEEQTAFVQITIDDWSENWMSRMLTFIFEALLLNPIYGGNPNEIGWKWLNHDPGFPRPTATTKYPELKTRLYEV